MASDDANDYGLGHSPQELARLRRQAQFTNRFTRQYLRRWYFRIGQWFEFWDRVRPHEEVVRVFGVPRWMYRVALVNFAQSVAGLLRGRRDQALDKQLEFVQFVGYVWGAMQRRRFGKIRNST